MPGKISGTVEFINDGNSFVKDENGKEYFFRKNYIVQSDKIKSIYNGKELNFYPWKSGDVLIATEIEIL